MKFLVEQLIDKLPDEGGHFRRGGEVMEERKMRRIREGKKWVRR